MLISIVQQSDSVIHIYILFHYGLSQDIEYRSLCFMVGPCCLYIYTSIPSCIWCQIPSSLSLPFPASFFLAGVGEGCGLGREARGILVPRPGMEPRPLTVKAQSPNPWTAREFPPCFIFIHILYHSLFCSFCSIVYFLTFVICLPPLEGKLHEGRGLDLPLGQCLQTDLSQVFGEHSEALV